MSTNHVNPHLTASPAFPRLQCVIENEAPRTPTLDVGSWLQDQDGRSGAVISRRWYFGRDEWGYTVDVIGCGPRLIFASEVVRFRSVCAPELRVVQ